MAEKKSATAKEEKAAQAAEQTAADQAAKNAEEAKDAKSAAKEDPTAALKQQIADLKKQLDEKDDQYLRAQAEIQNMNNHFKKERAQLIKYDGQGLAKDILPVLDNLKRALAFKWFTTTWKRRLRTMGLLRFQLSQARLLIRPSIRRFKPRQLRMIKKPTPLFRFCRLAMK